LAIGGERQAGSNVILSKLRIIAEDLFVRHTCGQPTKHVGHGDSHSPDTRAAAALTRLDGDNVLVIHGGNFILTYFGQGTKHQLGTFCITRWNYRCSVVIHKNGLSASSTRIS